MSLSGITFGGLSSGIDTTSIISKMLQLEAQPIKNYQARLSDIQGEQSVLSSLKSKLQSMSSAALALNAPFAFNPVKATTSDNTAATITTTIGAQPGIYSLSVSKLAQAQKISSAAQTDTTTALNKTGTIVVNGKTVKISATDSLTKIAQNINSASAGVTASLIDGGSGRAYLTVASNATGVSNKVQIADVSGTVLNDLGILGGAATPRETITNGVTSENFSSKTQTLDQLLPNTGITTASFQVNGNTVNVDFTVDTLSTLASKISAAGSTATVRTVTDSSGNSTYKLDIVSAGGGDTFTDPQNVLQSIGVLQQAPTTQLIAAQDASYSLDGVALTSATNTITTAIPGATLTLLKADSTTPVKSTLTLTKDADAIKKKISDFADSFNAAIDFINQNSQFDKDTFESGPLFGNPVAQQIVSSVSTLLFSNMPGAIGPYKNLASAGFSLDDKGKIVIDDTQLSAAIANSPDSLNSLFQTLGSATGTGVTYMGVGNMTHSGTYDVVVTTVPTYASYTALTAQTGPTSTTENLTFAGTMFGSNPVTLTIPQNTSESAIIDLINNDSRLNTNLVASDDGSGHLKLTSKKLGASGNFNISSDQPNTGGDTSGIGNGTDGTKVLGVDIAGTINGEPATGGANGILTGNTGNATTAGLQVQYTGSTTGLVGRVTANKGMSATITDLVNQFTDPVNGLLSTRDKALTAQEDDVNDSIKRLQDRISSLQLELQTKFANMESAIAQIQQQGTQLTNGFKSLSTG